MKVKSFENYLKQRLSEEEIEKIKNAAKLEMETLSLLQQNIASTLEKYMKERALGFNDIVKQLGKSPSQVSKILKAEANLTLAMIAHFMRLWD